MLIQIKTKSYQLFQYKILQGKLLGDFFCFKILTNQLSKLTIKTIRYLNHFIMVINEDSNNTQPFHHAPKSNNSPNRD